MISYPHVEDYLEIIAGKKSLPGAVPVNSFWTTYSPIINLARYDNSFLDNVTDQTMNGGALTDRQAELAVKLITKYRRQLNSQNIEVPDMTAPTFRRALRIVDRSKTAGVADGYLYLKFPYDQKTVDLIRAMSKQSQGYMVFDRETKIWKLALTEYNVNWVYEHARQNQYTIDDTLTALMSKIVECESQGYRLELEVQDNKLQIANAHASLNNYIEQNLGGFDLDNVIKLADAAPVFGYGIEQTLRQDLEAKVDGSVYLLIANKEYNFNDAEDIEKRVVRYAEATKRFPVVVFNPTPADNESQWTQHFDPSEILIIKNKKDLDGDLTNIKLVYTHKPLRNLDSISLLVSYVGMMIGTDKQVMLNAAQKVFYTAKKLK